MSGSKLPDKHRNDVYGDDLQRREDANDAIPAATVVLLRDDPELEVLMVHKSSKIAFGSIDMPSATVQIGIFVRRTSSSSITLSKSGDRC